MTVFQCHQTLFLEHETQPSARDDRADSSCYLTAEVTVFALLLQGVDLSDQYEYEPEVDRRLYEQRRIMKRTVTPELLDTDSGTPAEVATAFSDLRRINRWFGGIATTEEMVGRVARAINASSLSLLEVAAGAGYVPEIARQHFRKRGLNLQLTLLDRAPSHLSNGNQAVVADALALPFREESFDLVSCTLFAHHLGPLEFLQFIEEALRVCRVAVLINDIVRQPLHLSLVYAGLPLFRSRITRHDGLVSVRRAYTPEEMRTLFAQSTAARVELHRHYLFRMGIMAWKY